MSRVLAAWPVIAPLVRAVDALLAGDVVDITPLLPVVRAARIAGYDTAGVDDVDVVLLADVLRRRPDILDGTAESAVDGTLSLSDDDDSIALAPRRHRATRLLVDALIVGLESTKLRWGLRPRPAILKTVFASPDEARAVLAAVAAVPETILAQPLLRSPSTSTTPALRGANPGNVHVVVGPAARRLRDMLSPAVRRLRVDLALLGRHNGIVDDDDVYRGLALLDDEPGCRAERDAADAAEGLILDDDGAFVVDSTRLLEEHVDRRLRSLLLPLKKARATIVGIVDDDHLDAALTLAPKSIQIVVASSAVTSSAPWFVDAGSGAIVVGDSDDRVASLSVPSPLLVHDGVEWDDGAWRLQQAVAAARLVGPLPAPQTRSGDDLSALCAAAVAAMVSIPDR